MTESQTQEKGPCSLNLICSSAVDVLHGSVIIMTCRLSYQNSAGRRPGQSTHSSLLTQEPVYCVCAVCLLCVWCVRVVCVVCVWCVLVVCMVYVGGVCEVCLLCEQTEVSRLPGLPTYTQQPDSCHYWQAVLRTSRRQSATKRQALPLWRTCCNIACPLHVERQW